MRDAGPAQWTTAKNLTLSLSTLQGRGTTLSCYFQPPNFRPLLPDKPVTYYPLGLFWIPHFPDKINPRLLFPMVGFLCTSQ